MNEVQKLMAGREPGDMPSPMEFHDAFDADLRLLEPPSYSTSRMLSDIILPVALVMNFCAIWLFFSGLQAAITHKPFWSCVISVCV